MKKFQTIKIIHDVDNRIEFLFFAEFFHLCGIFVGEYIYYKDNTIREISLDSQRPDEIFDVELFAGKADDRDNNEVLRRCICCGEIIDFAGKHLSQVTDEERKSALIRMIDRIQETYVNLDIQTELLKRIGSVYVEEGLMWHCANIQYYRMYAKIHENTKNAFRNAYEKLNGQLNNSLSQNGYETICYAALYCASKANSACFYLKDSFIYEIDSLAETCRDLVKEYPQFSNAWVLLGLIYEHSPESAKEAVAAFENALKAEKTHSYASNIFYFMGKRYEEYDNNQADARNCYLSALNRKERFRNIYKLAVLDEKEKKYEDALANINKILACLSYKKEKNYLDPLELEYCYKSNSRASYICCVDTEQFDHAIAYGEQAIEMYDTTKDQKFFDDFYGEESNDYRELSKSRMNRDKVYQYIAVSYRGLGDNESSDRFWDKITNAEF